MKNRTANMGWARQALVGIATQLSTAYATEIDGGIGGPNNPPTPVAGMGLALTVPVGGLPAGTTGFYYLGSRIVTGDTVITVGETTRHKLSANTRPTTEAEIQSAAQVFGDRRVTSLLRKFSRELDAAPKCDECGAPQVKTPGELGEDAAREEAEDAPAGDPTE